MARRHPVGHEVRTDRALYDYVNELKASDEQKNAWYRHWVERGLEALPALRDEPGRIGG